LPRANGRLASRLRDYTTGCCEKKSYRKIFGTVFGSKLFRGCMDNITFRLRDTIAVVPSARALSLLGSETPEYALRWERGRERGRTCLRQFLWTDRRECGSQWSSIAAGVRAS